MATNEKEDHDQGRQGKEVSGEETCDSTTVDIGKMKEMIKNLEAARGFVYCKHIHYISSGATGTCFW